MAKSSRLRLADLRAIVQLVNECRDRGDDARGWRIHLAAELSRLVGAGVANVAESVGTFGPQPRGLEVIGWGWENGFDRRPWEQLIAGFRARGPGFNPMFRPYAAAFASDPGVCLSRPDLVSDREWYRSEYYELHRQVGTDVILYSDQGLATVDELSEAVFVRAIGEPDFTAREKVLVRETHRAVAPLIGGPLARFAEPSPADLPPRARQVLRCLIEGDSDKLIAVRLGISMHTVNGYTKLVYQHFGVSGRVELLARWVRRGWGSR